jgi:hypothetical protein
MLVAIFPGPGDQFRVRELAPEDTDSSIVKWTGNHENAKDYIREHYEERDEMTAFDFQQEVLARKKEKR